MQRWRPSSHYSSGKRRHATFILVVCRDDEKIQSEYVAVDKVNVTVFYETFCPGSRTFFKMQLGPAVQKLSRFINLSLVPYGNARVLQRHGVERIICDHGPVECLGNKIHACVLHLVQNTTSATLFNVCMMGVNGAPSNALFTCGDRHNLYTGAIWECASSSQGTTLLRKHGNTTGAAHPPYVPYTLLNGVSTNRRNLISALCATITQPPGFCLMYL
ncbi:Gamma-interferon-inducible lysosomal thiol reductase [Eumeta japonica]|uniref:Gamma-interferon-inducible lysosomal thiol reductase n=1 Tax=Eumeta variegata TaxID=151549 RepID=A0A4C1VN43_EUMVA|nr:Gamma-interferon-inducible lysosomal thiol reductase [Eumeta japonica]